MILKSLMITFLMLFSCTDNLIDESLQTRSDHCETVLATSCYWNDPAFGTGTDITTARFTGISIDSVRYFTNIETISGNTVLDSAPAEIVQFLFKSAKKAKLKFTGTRFSSRFFVQEIGESVQWNFGYENVEGDHFIEYHYVFNTPNERKFELKNVFSCAFGYDNPYPNFAEK